MMGFWQKNDFLALVLFSFFLWVASPAWAVQVHEKAPDFTLQDLHGNTVSLLSLKGKVVYLNFWASWCGPCKKEFPELARLAGRYKDSGFIVLAVNQDKKKENVNEFLSAYSPLPSNMTILLDPKFSVITSFGPRAMPSSFILDREGVVRYVHFGFGEMDPSKWPGEVEALLK
jgi:thiol-disulfide isomerase/thioredoxin